MGLLFFLDKFWQTKRFSMAVMPPAFFSYNAVIGYLYITSPSPELAYIFFSSLGFLPILAIAGIVASGLAVTIHRVTAPPQISTGHAQPTNPSGRPPPYPDSRDHRTAIGTIETLHRACYS